MPIHIYVYDDDVDITRWLTNNVLALLPLSLYVYICLQIQLSISIDNTLTEDSLEAMKSDIAS